jgi:hypothetical protein
MGSFTGVRRLILVGLIISAPLTPASTRIVLAHRATAAPATIACASSTMCWETDSYDAMYCDDGTFTPLDQDAGGLPQVYHGEDQCHLVTVTDIECLNINDPWDSGDDQWSSGDDGGGGGGGTDTNQNGKDNDHDNWIDCMWQAVGSSEHPELTPCQSFGSSTTSSPACPTRTTPHNGMDFPVPDGTDVFSVGTGYVAEVGNNGDNGNFIRVNHPDGTQSVYLHLQNDSITVAQNDQVTPGTRIAKSDNTGNSHGSHWSSQDLVETLASSAVSRFKLLGTDTTEMTVATRRIVEPIDVVAHLVQGQRSVLVDLLLDPFLLQAAEERLRDGIVPTIAFSAHARLQVMGPTETPPGIAAELRPLIRMNQRPSRTSTAYRREDRVEDEVAVQGRGRCPADDLPREEIHHHGQVQPALPCPNVRDVRDPRLVSTGHGELPLQEIRDQHGRLADRPPSRAIAMQGAQVIHAHQPGDAMLAAGLARLPKVQKDAGALTRGERRADQRKESRVLLTSR